MADSSGPDDVISRAASRWLEVECDVPVFSGLTRVRKYLGAGFRALMPAGGLDFAADCQVVLKRRDNGAVVWAMEHNRSGEAITHAASLTERLGSTGLWDIARELGIRFNDIADAQPDDLD